MTTALQRRPSSRLQLLDLLLRRAVKIHPPPGWRSPAERKEVVAVGLPAAGLMLASSTGRGSQKHSNTDRQSERNTQMERVVHTEADVDGRRRRDRERLEQRWEEEVARETLIGTAGVLEGERGGVRQRGGAQ